MVYKRPFPNSKISSGYGMRGLAGGTFHEGIDYALALNTPLPAIGPGTIVEIGESKKFGKYIKVDADVGGYYRWHACNGFVPGLGVGSRVHTGQTIAYSGRTGFWSTGPHGHLQTTNGDNPNTFYNPLSVLADNMPTGSGATPIPPAVLRRVSTMYLAHDSTTKTIWLVTEDGFVGLTSPAHANLFIRLLNRNPADHSDSFNRTEIDIMNSYLWNVSRRDLDVAGAQKQPAPVVDMAPLVAAIGAALKDVKFEGINVEEFAEAVVNKTYERLAE